ncbi:MAG: ABC transporter permease [Deltaproteobacteria bacterium]|nr:ABC transporter permease [Deltaproteobacteria bacterium]MBW2085034.1 ABC transporter permease [Deltaproteobacteria bacterium]
MSESTTDVIGRPGEPSKRRSSLADFVIRLVKEKPLGTAGAIVTLIMLFVGIFANFLAPYGMNEIHPIDFLSPPSAKYLLGTDNLGRDMLSRIIFGARISIIVGLVASTLATAVSVLVGILTGYIGGKFDLLIQRFVDAFMCFPGLVFLIAVASIVGPGLWQVIICLGLLYGVGGSRIVRGAVIGIRENMYVDAAEAIGCPQRKILTMHILPNIMAPIIILFTTRVPAMILAESGLSFLGLGIPPPAPSWGGMLSGAGRDYMFKAPWMAIWPGLALCIVVYSVNMLGDAVRDILDPRLRGGLGSYSIVKARKALSKAILRS